MNSIIIFLVGVLVGHFGVSKIVAWLKTEEQTLAHAPTITVTAKQSPTSAKR